MKKEKRNTFLTIQLDHKCVPDLRPERSWGRGNVPLCLICRNWMEWMVLEGDEIISVSDASREVYKEINFSTWEGFGQLWEWSKQQSWFEDFLNICDVGEYISTKEMDGGFTVDIQMEFINPDVFADAVYEFLSDQENVNQ